jgi:hypothetical protein
MSHKENRAALRDIISVLADWRVKEAVEQLLYMLDDKQYGDTAADALRKITGKEIEGSSRKEWEEALSHQGGKIKSDFVKRLTDSNGQELTQTLSDLASSRYRRLWPDPEVFGALLKASKRITTWEQANAFAMIVAGNKKDPRSQRILITLTGSAEDPEVRKTLITALVQHFPNGDTVDYLLDLLERNDRRLRMIVRNALYEVTGAVSSKHLKTKSDWLEYFSKHPSARWGKQEK